MIEITVLTLFLLAIVFVAMGPKSADKSDETPPEVDSEDAKDSNASNQSRKNT